MLPFLLEVDEHRRQTYLRRLDNIHKDLARISPPIQKVAAARSFVFTSPHTPHESNKQIDGNVLLPLNRNRKRGMTDIDDEMMIDRQEHSSTPTQPPDEERRKKKPKLSRLARRHIAQFLPVTLALSDTSTTEDLISAQVNFVTELSTGIKSLNKKLQFETADHRAHEFRRVFFEGMLGHAMLERLARFCRGYTSTLLTTKSAKTTSLTALNDMMIDLTLKSGMPAEIEDCYETLRQYHSMDDNSVDPLQLAQQPQTRRYKESFAGTSHHLIRLHRFRLFDSCLDNLLSLLSLPDTDMVAFFKSNNVTPYPGRDGKNPRWKSVVTEYLCKIVDIPQGKVELLRTQMRIVDEMIETFGEGVLVLMLVSSHGGLDR